MPVGARAGGVQPGGGIGHADSSQRLVHVIVRGQRLAVAGVHPAGPQVRRQAGIL